MLELVGYDKKSNNLCCYRITGGMSILFSSRFEFDGEEYGYYEPSVHPASIAINVFGKKGYFYIKRSDSNDISKEEYNKLFSQLVNDEKVVLSDEYIIDDQMSS